MFLKLTAEQKALLSNIVRGEDVDLSPVHQHPVQPQPADLNSALNTLAAGVQAPVNNVIERAVTTQDYLKIAAAHGNLEVLKKVVNKDNQAEAIRLLLKHGHIEQFKALWADKGIKIDVSLFKIVAASGNQDAINFVLEDGNIEGNNINNADSNLEGLRGKTLLDVACAHGNVEAVKRLIALGAKVTRLKKNGDSHLDGLYNPDVLKILLSQKNFPLLEKKDESPEQLKGKVKDLKKEIIPTNNRSTPKIDADVLAILLDDESIDIDYNTFNALIGQKNYKAAKLFIEKRRASLEPSFIGAMIETSFHIQARNGGTFLSGLPENYQTAFQRQSFFYSFAIELFVVLPLMIEYDSAYPMLLLPAYLVLHGAYNKYYLVPGFLDAVVKLGEEQEAKELAAKEQEDKEKAAEKAAIAQAQEEISTETQNEFIAACIKGDLDSVKRMIGETSSIATRVKTLNGKTGVHIAIETGNLGLLGCFTQDQIMSAIDDEHYSPFRLLLANKKNIDETKYGAMVDYFFNSVFPTVHIDANRNTPIHIAAICNDLDLVNRAIAFDGVDVLTKNNSGHTALRYCDAKKEILKVIAAKYAALQQAEDANKALVAYLKDLIALKQSEFCDVLKTLKESGVDIQALSDELLTAAIKKEYSNAVKAIIYAVDTIDAKHLFAAAKSSCINNEMKRIVRDLVKAGIAEDGKPAKLDLDALSEKGYWFNKKNWLDTFLQRTLWKEDVLQKSGYYGKVWTERGIGAACAAVTFFVIQYTERSAFFQLCATGIAYKLAANYYDKHYLKPAVEKAMAGIEIS